MQSVPSTLRILNALVLMLASVNVAGMSASADSESDSITFQARYTKSLRIFMRDDSHLEVLGESWRDPSGLIWGDLLRDHEGSPVLLTAKEAYWACVSLNPREKQAAVNEALKNNKEPPRGLIFLPLVHNFTRLRAYLGATQDEAEGYEPQVLPNLVNVDPSSSEVGSSIDVWTSSPTLSHDLSQIQLFRGLTGQLMTWRVMFKPRAYARCVVRRTSNSK